MLEVDLTEEPFEIKPRVYTPPDPSEISIELWYDWDETCKKLRNLLLQRCRK